MNKDSTDFNEFHESTDRLLDKRVSNKKIRHVKFIRHLFAEEKTSKRCSV